MKIILRIISIYVLIFQLISCGQQNSSTLTIVEDTELFNVANTLPTKGVLAVSKKGFVYLKVSDEYSNILYPMLLKRLPASETKCLQKANDAGNHITLFYPHTLSPEVLNSLPIGKEFNFHINKIEKIVVKKYWHQKLNTKIWFVITVDSPELLSLMTGIAKTKLHTTPFHISFANAKLREDGSCLVN